MTNPRVFALRVLGTPACYAAAEQLMHGWVASASQLYGAYPCGQETWSYHLHRMDQAGLITRTAGFGGRHTIRATPLLTRLMKALALAPAGPEGGTQ